MSLPEKSLTRRELYLAKAAGQDVTLPETDLTREEMYLREIANGGGGGDVTKEYVDTAIANAVADIDDDISALSDTVADKVDKVNGKGLSTNDYTDADKALVQDSPITVTATASPISTANGKPRAITIYGKSEIVDGAIKSAGEGWSTVDLGTLNWTYYSSSATPIFYAGLSQINAKANSANMLCPLYTPESGFWNEPNNDMKIATSTSDLFISNSQYTNPSAFKTAMTGVILAYKEAHPTNNTIAIKTDNGTGINGTMATFTTGTPLRGIPETTVRDVMEWNGTSGEVTKKCAELDLGDLIWVRTTSYNNPFFWATIADVKINTYSLCSEYNSVTPYGASDFGTKVPNKSYTISSNSTQLFIRDDDYADAAAFQTAMSGVKLIYELATPTTQNLTSTENDSMASLRTFTPQTHIQNNAGADMTVEAYAGTANGQAISDMQPTRSPLLTLTASGWTNNAQTATYEHDTSKRNSIDVEPANIKAWTAAGILATAETASTITFECDTVPTADLSFRVTSMEVR